MDHNIRVEEGCPVELGEVKVLYLVILQPVRDPDYLSFYLIECFEGNIPPVIRVHLEVVQ